MNKIIFLVEKYDAHVLRFKNSFEKNGCEVEIFRTGDLVYETKKIDLTIPRILVFNLNNSKYITKSKNQKVYGVCLAYELYTLDSVTTEKNLKNQTKNLNGIIFDNPVIQKKYYSVTNNVNPNIVVPFGYETNLINNKAKNKNVLSIAALRNWSSTHCQNLVLKTLLDLENFGIDYEVHFAGHGSQKAELLANYSKQVKKGIIVDHGEINENEVEEILSRTHIYLSAALSDGTSITLLQAMANKNRVILRDIESNRFLVEQMPHSLLTNYRDYEHDDIIQFILKSQEVDYENDLFLEETQNHIKRIADWEKNSKQIVDFVMATNV